MKSLVCSVIAFVALTPLNAGRATAASTDAGTLAQHPTQQGDLWRASKLPGIAIYGPNDERVGKISDVLVDRSGSARYLVIGVGGFLGIGEKDVAVPFGDVTFTDTPLASQLTATHPLPGALAPAGGMAPATTGEVATGLPAAQPNMAGPAVPPNASPDMKIANDRTRAYPDHGMLAMTKDQLKSAPPFRFSR
jgi:hypothetical protein